MMAVSAIACLVYLTTAAHAICLSIAGSHIPQDSNGAQVFLQGSRNSSRTGIREGFPTIQALSTTIFRDQNTARQSALSRTKGYILADWATRAVQWQSFGPDPNQPMPADDLMVAGGLIYNCSH